MMALRHPYSLMMKNCRLACLAVLFCLNSFAARADETINPGETVYDRVLSGSDLLKVSGTAVNTTINSAAIMNVLANGVAEKTTINNGGRLGVVTTGIANNTTVNQGGNFSLTLGGTANDTVVDGGTMSLLSIASLSPAIANRTTVKNGGTLTASTSTQIKNTVVDNRGTVTMDKTAVAYSTTVNNGGRLTLKDTAIANDSIINEGGRMDLSYGGAANNTIINGGSVSISSSSAVVGHAVDTTLNAGSFTVASGDATKTIINGGTMTVTSNGKTFDTEVNDGGRLNIYGNINAKNTTVNDGGYIIATQGNVVLDGLTLSENAKYYLSTATTVANASQNGREVSIAGGAAENFVINNESQLSVANSHSAKNIVVKNGGKISGSVNSTIDGAVLEEGAQFEFTTGGEVINTTQNGKDVSISNGKATGFDVTEGSRLSVVAGTEARDTMLSGGIATVMGNIYDIRVNSGELSLNNNGTADNAVIEQKGNLTMSDNTVANNVILNGGNINSSGNSKITNLQINQLNKTELSPSDLEEINTIKEMTNSAEFKAIYDKYMNDEALTSEEEDLFNTVLWGNIVVASLPTEKASNAVNVEGLNAMLEKRDGDATLKQITNFYRVLSFAGMTEKEIYETIFQSGKEVMENEIYSSNILKAGNVKDATIGNMGLIIESTADNVTVNDGGFIASTGGLYAAEPGSVSGNAAVIDNLTLNKGSAFVLSTYDTLTNASQEGKAVSIENNVADGFTINDSSSLVVAGNGTAQNTVVNSGGELKAETAAKIINLVANGGAILDLDSGAVLSGDIVIDKLADVSSSTYDFSNLFDAGNTDANSLTVSGGVNEAFTDKLVNEDSSKDKTLTLADGQYNIANVIKEGSTQVAGWDVINITAAESAPATVVKLESDIALVGSNKDFIIGKNAVLDVSGHSPLDIIIDGNVINNGLIDFTVNDFNNEADDTTTITGNYTAQNGAMIALNIEPENGKADLLKINGDVAGKTSVYLKTSSEQKSAGDILFAEVPNDSPDTASDFSIWRVEGSPYEWGTRFEDNKWYTFSEQLNHMLVPEMIAYMGLYDAGFEQTRSLSRALRNNTGANGCLKNWKPAHTAWAAPVYSNVKVKSPYDYDASIGGLDAGIDLAANGINKIGIMASYRRGSYDFSGKSDDFFANGGSDIDIDSYLLGLYFRHDDDNIKAIAAVFGGMQHAEISSDDGVRAKTDGLQAGVTLDVAYIWEAVKGITLEPELQVTYTMLKYDNFADNAGKKIKPETAHRAEAEAGVKLKKSWELQEGEAAVYVKPGVVQTYNDGGKFHLTHNISVDSLDNQTLARIETGAEFKINDRWSAGVSAAYTFNSDYRDTSVNLDLQYRF